MGRWGRVGLGLVVLGVVVGCTPESGGTPSPTPSSVFSREPWVMPGIVGETVSASPLESDEWVIAMREAELGEALAFNSADFSIEPFVSAVTPDYADALYEFYVRRWVGDEDRVVWPGSRILLPLEVELVDENHAIVRFCGASDYWQDEDASRLSKGFISTSEMVRTEDGIRESDVMLTLDRCDATGAPIARFDPAPRPLGPLIDADVIPPPA